MSLIDEYKTILNIYDMALLAQQSIINNVWPFWHNNKYDK